MSSDAAVVGRIELETERLFLFKVDETNVRGGGPNRQVLANSLLSASGCRLGRTAHASTFAQSFHISQRPRFNSLPTKRRMF